METKVCPADQGVALLEMFYASTAYTSQPLMSQVWVLSLDIHLIKAIIVNNSVSFSDDTIQKSPIVLISF